MGRGERGDGGEGSRIKLKTPNESKPITVAVAEPQMQQLSATHSSEPRHAQRWQPKQKCQGSRRAKQECQEGQATPAWHLSCPRALKVESSAMRTLREGSNSNS